MLGTPAQAQAATISSMVPSVSKLSVSPSPSVRRAEHHQQQQHPLQTPAPLIQSTSATPTQVVQSQSAHAMSTEQRSGLSLSVRENDAEYQLRRMILMERLLRGYPHTRALIAAEAKHDVPPLYRPYVWASLLGVQVQYNFWIWIWIALLVSLRSTCELPYICTVVTVYGCYKLP